MDRHIRWLRHRILVSVAAKTGITFAGTFVVGVALLMWRTDASSIVTLLVAFFAAQAVTVARVMQAIRNNPLGYSFLKGYIASPYRYSIAASEGKAHDEASELLGFYPVIAVHDATADPSPVFDLFQTGDRVTTASVSRASGAVSLFSQLDDGRILVTDSRLVVPHEGLAVNPAPGLHPARLIAAHNKAVASIPGGATREPQALKLMSQALKLEHSAYCQLGPVLGPFLDLEPHRRSFGRLVVTLDLDSLSRLGVSR